MTSLRSFNLSTPPNAYFVYNPPPETRNDMAACDLLPLPSNNVVCILVLSAARAIAARSADPKGDRVLEFLVVQLGRQFR
jgi:hypothetical protein